MARGRLIKSNRQSRLAFHISVSETSSILSYLHVICSESLIDTAQSYRNEEEAGIAIRESGLSREEIFITTKYSGLNGLDIQTSIVNSLKNVGFRLSRVGGKMLRENISWVSHTSTYTSYIIHPSRFRIFQRPGDSLKNSKRKG
jgi:hypothetical protein